MRSSLLQLEPPTARGTARVSDRNGSPTRSKGCRGRDAPTNAPTGDPGAPKTKASGVGAREGDPSQRRAVFQALFAACPQGPACVPTGVPVAAFQDQGAVAAAPDRPSMAATPQAMARDQRQQRPPLIGAMLQERRAAARQQAGQPRQQAATGRESVTAAVPGQARFVPAPLRVAAARRPDSRYRAGLTTTTSKRPAQGRRPVGAGRKAARRSSPRPRAFAPRHGERGGGKIESDTPGQGPGIQQGEQQAARAGARDRARGAATGGRPPGPAPPRSAARCRDADRACRPSPSKSCRQKARRPRELGHGTPGAALTQKALEAPAPGRVHGPTRRGGPSGAAAGGRGLPQQQARSRPASSIAGGPEPRGRRGQYPVDRGGGHSSSARRSASSSAMSGSTISSSAVPAITSSSLWSVSSMR